MVLNFMERRDRKILDKKIWIERKVWFEFGSKWSWYLDVLIPLIIIVKKENEKMNKFDILK